MDMPERYPPSMVLARVADHLQDHHSHLTVGLSTSHPTYEEALAATIECVRGLPGRIHLPTTNPARRAALRAQALENKHLLEVITPFSSSRPIRTTGNLNPEDCPTPPSPGRRALLKKKFLDGNDPPLREPYILDLHALRLERTLTALVGNATITAVDWEPGMPECQLKGAEMLWDTGATTTIITKDLLDEKFQTHLCDPIHSDYQNHDGTRVHISLKLEFTNSLFSMDLIAWVVDKKALPNTRSGILLGQRGCIDAIQYRSIPRSILEARGETVEERFWGDLVLESYVDLDGTLKEIV